MASAFTIQQLTQMLQQPAYEKRTDEQLRDTAGNKVASKYNQLGLAATQKTEQDTLSLQNQLAALTQTYDRQRRDTMSNTQNALSQQGNAAISRGLGRSTFNLGTLGGIQQTGLQNLSDIDMSESTNRNAINSQISLAERQLNDLLAQYKVDKYTDIEALVDDMSEEDYAKWTDALNTRNQLTQWMAQYSQQQEQFDYAKSRDTIADQQRAEAIAREQANLLQQAQSYSSGRSGGYDPPKVDDYTPPKDPAPIITKYLNQTENIAKTYGDVPLKGLPKVQRGLPSSGITQDILKGVNSGSLTSNPALTGVSALAKVLRKPTLTVA